MAEDPVPVVKFSGAIGVQNIAAAYEKLLETAETEFAIDLSDVTELDITLLQLVESARHTGAPAGRCVRLAKPAHGPVLETLERAGFLNEAAPERRAFWLGVTQ